MWKGEGEEQDREKGIRGTNVSNKEVPRVCCTTQGISSIFYNNFAWSITFKNYESLCCSPVIDITLYINYISFSYQSKYSAYTGPGDGEG